MPISGSNQRVLKKEGGKIEVGGREGEQGRSRGKRRGGNRCDYCGSKHNNLIVTMQSIKM